MKPGRENTPLFLSMPPFVPSGGSPDGTGESPVLPTVNTYDRPRSGPRTLRVRSDVSTDESLGTYNPWLCSVAAAGDRPRSAARRFNCRFQD